MSGPLITSAPEETIAQRIARGKEQNSADGGAIVPFPDDTDFTNPVNILPGYQRKWITEGSNDGYELSAGVYRSEAGVPIFATLRLDHPDYCPDRPELKKRIKPLRCDRVLGCLATAVLGHIKGTRPLYNLEGLAARPNDPVLMVEGEWTADAAQVLFPDYVAITWPGGAQSDRLVDLLPLAGRSVTIWPDQDEEGRAAASRLACRALLVGATICRMVQVPTTFRKKWDLANADEGGEITPELLRKLLDEAPQVMAEETDATRKRTPKPTGESEPMAKSGDLAGDEALLRFLIEGKLISLDARGDWIRVGLALKASHGEEGFVLWDRLSSEAAGYDGSTIGRDWATFGKRGDDQPTLTMATFAKMAVDAGWSPPARQSSNSKGSSKDNGGGPRFGKGVDPAAAAVTLAEEAGDEFWLDQHDKPHVSYTVKGPEGDEIVRHAPIGSAAYKRELGHRYNQALPNKVLAKDQATNAATLLEYRAFEGGLRFTSSLRVGEFEDRIYVDLGRHDGHAVEITRDGWDIIDCPPVRFVRGSRGELPPPEPGGSLSDFAKHFNLTKADVLRVVAFMVGTFNLSGSYPILFIEGEQGTCKSTLADMLLALIDPPTSAKSARLSFASDEKDFHVIASGARVLCFDNISSFSAAVADAFCRMATGAASSSRRLYTDDEEARLVVLRPVIATCIGLPSSRPDLLSRAVRVRTLPVELRRSEKGVMKDFNMDRSKLLGFLMTCVSAALRNRDSIEAAADRGEIKLPRMGDFGLFIESAAEVLGLGPGEFSKLIENEQTDMQIEAAQGDPVGAALLRYFSNTDAPPILGAAREVLSLLQAETLDERRWPPANKLGNQLTRIAVGLRLLGIAFDTKDASGRDNVIRYHIYTTDAFVRQGHSGPSNANEPF